MKIRLLTHHEHAGRVYPPNSELTLAQAEAEWLIALKRAEPAAVKPAKTPKEH